MLPVHRNLLVASVALAISSVQCGRESDARVDGVGGRAAGAYLETIREAPPFELETLEGDTLSLADLDSVPVILMNFWASWCGPCKIEIPDLMVLHEKYAARGFMVLGVTVNDLPRDSREFAAEVDMSYPSVIGTPQMLEAYELSPWLPTSLLVQDGRVVKEWVGPRSREEFEYPVKVALGLAPAPSDLMEDEEESAGEARDGR
ncbi:MAG TPA: TlpA disulfide reductase family protein [Gemmatimonadota bacterium]|nr:TlpA disulfide reductase family protein [Gemmatimonadota bacterium]